MTEEVHNKECTSIDVGDTSTPTTSLHYAFMPKISESDTPTTVHGAAL